MNVGSSAMRSIVGATQREQRLGLALNWCVSRSGVRAAPRSQSVPYSQPVDRLKRSGVASSGKIAYRKADDLWARFKVSEWRVFCHMARLRNSPPRLRFVLSDGAFSSVNHAMTPFARQSSKISSALSANSASLMWHSIR